MKAFMWFDVVPHLVAAKKAWSKTKAIAVRIRTKRSIGGTRSQKTLSKIIATVSRARTAVVIGMYMLF
jgi:hypothetical protein